MPILQGRDRVPSDVRRSVSGSQRLGSCLGAQVGSVLVGFLTILTLWFLVPASPIWAETMPTIAAPTPPQALDSATIPAETLSRFVRAYLDVFTLIDQREGDLQSAETETLSLRIRQEIEAEAYRRIESTGMSRQEYIQILSLANIDPELGEQIAAQLQEAGTEMP
jgi:Domain of unknown function (DUF4168)